MPMNKISGEVQHRTFFISMVYHCNCKVENLYAVNMVNDIAGKNVRIEMKERSDNFGERFMKYLIRSITENVKSTIDKNIYVIHIRPKKSKEMQKGS